MLIFTKSVRGGIEIRKDVLLKYMEVTYPIYMIDETLECGCLRWSTNHEENHSLVTVHWLSAAKTSRCEGIVQDEEFTDFT